MSDTDTPRVTADQDQTAPVKRRPPPPFSDPEFARAASAKGREAQALTRQTLAQIAKNRPEILTADVGPMARAAATKLAADLVGDGIPIKYVHYAAQAIRHLVEVARLEEGKPTNLTASVTADAQDFRDYVETIRTQALKAQGNGRDDDTPDPMEAGDTPT